MPDRNKPTITKDDDKQTRRAIAAFWLGDPDLENAVVSADKGPYTATFRTKLPPLIPRDEARTQGLPCPDDAIGVRVYSGSQVAAMRQPMTATELKQREAARLRSDPEAFAAEMLGVELSPWQKNRLAAVQKAGHIGSNWREYGRMCNIQTTQVDPEPDIFDGKLEVDKLVRPPIPRSGQRLVTTCDDPMAVVAEVRPSAEHDELGAFALERARSMLGDALDRNGEMRAEIVRLNEHINGLDILFEKQGASIQQWMHSNDGLRRERDKAIGLMTERDSQVLQMAEVIAAKDARIAELDTELAKRPAAFVDPEPPTMKHSPFRVPARDMRRMGP